MRSPKSIGIVPRPRTWVLPAVLLVLSAATAPGADTPGPKPDGKAPAKREASPLLVGQIIVVGNETVPQRVALRQVPLSTGGPLVVANLPTAERNLERLGIFEVAKGFRPRVEIVDPYEADSEYRDILVVVTERPHAWLRWQSVETLAALATCSTGRGPLALIDSLSEWAWYANYQHGLVFGEPIFK
jgi:hypothetical protein